MHATRIVAHPSLTLPSASSHPTPSPPHALRNTLHIKPGIFSWKKLLDRKRRSEIFRLCTWRNFPRIFFYPSNPKISWKCFLLKKGLTPNRMIFENNLHLWKPAHSSLVIRSGCWTRGGCYRFWPHTYLSSSLICLAELRLILVDSSE